MSTSWADLMDAEKVAETPQSFVAKLVKLPVQGIQESNGKAMVEVEVDGTALYYSLNVDWSGINLNAAYKVAKQQYPNFTGENLKSVIALLKFYFQNVEGTPIIPKTAIVAWGDEKKVDALVKNLPEKSDKVPTLPPVVSKPSLETTFKHGLANLQFDEYQLLAFALYDVNQEQVDYIKYEMSKVNSPTESIKRIMWWYKTVVDKPITKEQAKYIHGHCAAHLILKQNEHKLGKSTVAFKINGHINAVILQKGWIKATTLTNFLASIYDIQSDYFESIE